MASERAARAGDPVATLLMKLRARDVLSDAEEQVLRESVSEVREVTQGRIIVRSGTMLSECTLLVDGYMARFKDTADGQRQIMEIHVAGDFVDLHSFLLKRLEHHVGSMTPVRYVNVSHERVRFITENHPHLARMLWFSTLVDAAIHRERIMSIGRRSAVARISHLMCELYCRLQVVGLADGHSFRFPLTQADLADASGLTAVHVNRMLRQLRDEELLTFRGGEVIIHQWDRLQRIAEFSDSYLFLERLPR